jgi:serine/threonine protein phosphatase 1
MHRKPAADGGTREAASAAAGDSPDGPTFGPRVAADHRRLDSSAWGEVYVVGDVHGCIDELRTLWDRLDPVPADLVVFVGDLVRKGPDSVAAVEFVADRPNAVSVLGNNEAKLLAGRVEPDWAPAVTDAVAEFPLAISWDDALAVHGGVHPTRPLVEHDRTDLLEMRAVPPGNGYDGPFWFECYDGPPRVFFGHTVLEDPYVSPAAVGLDTGCVYGGALSAYDCENETVVSVPAERPYRERPDAKVVSPPAVVD